MNSGDRPPETSSGDPSSSSGAAGAGGDHPKPPGDVHEESPRSDRLWVDLLLAGLGLLAVLLMGALIVFAGAALLTNPLAVALVLLLVVTVVGMAGLFLGAVYLPDRVARKRLPRPPTGSAPRVFVTQMPFRYGDHLSFPVAYTDALHSFDIGTPPSWAGPTLAWVPPADAVAPSRSQVVAATLVDPRTRASLGIGTACVLMIALGITSIFGVALTRYRAGQVAEAKKLDRTNAAIARLHSDFGKVLSGPADDATNGAGDGLWNPDREGVGLAPLMSLEGKVRRVESGGSGAGGSNARLAIAVDDTTGFKVGDMLSVYRPGPDSKYLGRVRVQSIDPDQHMVVAGALPGLVAAEVRPNDVAAVNLPTPELRSAERAALSTPMATAAMASEEKIYWGDNGERTLHVLPNVVAVEGERIASRTGGERPAPEGVRGFADNVVPFAPIFADQGIYFLSVDPARQDQVQKTFSRSGSIKRTGLVAWLKPPVADPAGRSVVVIPPEFIVRFKPEVPRERIDEINRNHGVVILREQPGVANQFLLAPADLDPERMLELTEVYGRLPENGGLSDPNFIRPRRSLSVDRDVLLPEQWHLQNTGRAEGSAGADVRAVQAWEVTSGKPSVVVAVIDGEGIQISHEDLEGNLLVNELELRGRLSEDDDKNGYKNDVYGWNFLSKSGDPTTRLPHGTAVAGLVSAVKDNGLGGCGVAPGCRLLPICLGQGDDDDAAAFRYARDRGADVIVCSWGYLGSGVGTDVKAAIADVTTRGRRNGKGCVVVFALSNEMRDNFGPDLTELVALPNVIAVGRSTNRDAWGSCGFGRGTTVLAPTGCATGTEKVGCDPTKLAGTLEITTTDLMDREGYNRVPPGGPIPRMCECNPRASESSNLNYTSCFHGTSASTPVVGGVCALILSVNEDFTPRDVYEILIDSADKIDRGRARYTKDANGRLWSRTHGFGRVNAESAVKLARQRRPGSDRGRGTGGARPGVVPPPAPRPEDSTPRADGGDRGASEAPEVELSRGDRPPILPGSRRVLLASFSPSDAPDPVVADDPPSKGPGAAGPDAGRPGGCDSERHTLRVEGKDVTVFTPRHTWALLLTPDVDRDAVLEQLGAAYKPLKTEWADALDRTRSVLVVEGPAGEWAAAERAFRPAIAAGLVRSIGRVLFLGDGGPRSVVVLTGQVTVTPWPEVDEEHLRRSARSLGMNVTRSPYDRSRFTLSAGTGSADPLEIAGLSRKLEEVGLINPVGTRPRWIVPIQQRL